MANLEQQVLEMQGHLPKGVTHWRAFTAIWSEQQRIELTVSLNGAYLKHEELPKLLKAKNIPVTSSENEAGGARIWRRRPKKATYRGLSDDVGKYVIEVLTDYNANAQQIRDYAPEALDEQLLQNRGEVRLKAKRADDFGKMHLLVEVIEQYVGLFDEKGNGQPGNSGNGDEGSGSGEGGGNVFNVR